MLSVLPEIERNALSLCHLGIFSFPINNHLHCLAHSCHSFRFFFKVFYSCPYFGVPDIPIVITAEILHQRTDLIRSPICAVHIYDMCTVVEQLPGFLNRPFNIVNRQTISQNIICRNKYDICLRQVRIFFTRSRQAGIKHRTVQPRPFRSGSLIFLLYFDIILLACIIRCINVQPYRTAKQIADRKLCCRPCDGQVLSFQDDAKQLLCALFIS